MSESGAGDARYSPRTLGSRPADSLVKTPVSNDPCQRPARAAVMTYHTSSLRPRTDNCNHVTRFFPIFFPPLLGSSRRRRRSLDKLAQRGQRCGLEG